MKTRWILWLLCLSLLACMLPGCARQEGLQVMDGRGDPLIRAAQPSELFTDDRGAYLDIVLKEATAAVAEAEGCTSQEAQQRLFEGYTVYTAFLPEAFAAMQHGLRAADQGNSACAMTDLTGGLVAVYNTDPDQNRVTLPAAPYSSLKPLSVYAPALEQGIIRWNTTFLDSAYKQIKGEDGEPVDWPSNASGRYSNTQVTLSQAIGSSLNTVAVKCLAQLGVEQSVSFLQEQLGIDLDREKKVLEAAGGEEIIGNVALGYLDRGISPVDMAGYYQIFGNEGKYIPPAAVQRICNASGEQIYLRQEQPKQVISPATAQLMNLLLRSVVERGGTGEAAASDRVQVAGKTGTGDRTSDSWFVGLTPSYSCAVWHGKAMENRAADIFSQVVEGFYRTGQAGPAKFPEFTWVQQVRFCTKSGLVASNGCPVVETGYLPAEEVLSICDEH